jgi:tetratricopeptide repeat protein 21B
VLELLSRFLGAHPEAQLLYARTLFLNGALDAAARKAASILRANRDSTQAALLVVSIHLRQERPTDALAALESAVSANFGIREAPLYHVVHAQVLMANGQLEGARQVLESAMGLPGVRSPAAPEQAARLAKRGCLPSLHERASIFLLLAEAVTKQGKVTAAADARKVGNTGACRAEGHARVSTCLLTVSGLTRPACLAAWCANRSCTMLCASLRASARRCA